MCPKQQTTGLNSVKLVRCQRCSAYCVTYSLLCYVRFEAQPKRNKTINPARRLLHITPTVEWQNVAGHTLHHHL